MVLSRIINIANGNIYRRNQVLVIKRFATHYRSGAMRPLPDKMPFGIIGVFCTVIPGLLIGAAISKSIANFLEENELFVPSDDDDDDD